jgi:23S rRNA 5-hydroxycytidine C2501 synthase
VGFSQLVLARELTIEQIAAIRAAAAPETILEFFVHGALCVAYSGQCYIGEAHTGRSANRGECNQACRLPYQVTDAQGRFIAHDKHVLSMKDNDQSANMRALIDAGIRSFKIEGRYKDMAYVKNITAHYRQLLDEVLDERPELAAASSGKTSFSFTPEPQQNFNRESTDYFVRGRLEAHDPLHIGAFDTPKHSGMPLGWVKSVAADHFELETDPELGELTLSNGDGLTYLDLQKNLVGVHVNRVEHISANRWRAFPREAIATFKDLRKGTTLRRNRDSLWLKQLDKKSSDRRIGAWLSLREMAIEVDQVHFSLEITDENGVSAQNRVTATVNPASNATKNEATLREGLTRLGGTIYSATDVSIELSQPWFIPASTLNAARREAIEALEAARAAAFVRLHRNPAIEPPVAFPQDSLSYLGNVLNHQAHAFYTRHGVKVIAPAYEAYQELGEVSLMITKHCVRWSMSLCPKQAKGVVGVKGTIKAEPLMLINGKEKLTLKFDCKPCEMHVVGKMKPGQLQIFKNEVKQAAEQGVPMKFYKSRPKPGVATST